MAVEVLNQDEIDALLHGVDSGAVDMQAPTPKGEARQYDFATQTRIVRGRMPTLEMINERFARQLRISLFNMLRRSPDVAVAPISLPKFGDYLPTLQVPTNLNLIKINPLSGTALVILEPKLVFAVIDNFFGGNGRHAKIEGREFTPTEMQIIDMLLKQIFAGMKDAWMPVMGIDMEYLNSEINPHFANIVTPTEIVVVTRFHIELEGGGGDIHVTIPYSMIEPIKDVLKAGMQSDRADKDEHWSQILRNELEETEIELVTQMCEARISLGELLDLKPGDVIPCNFDGQATVMADGLPLLHGEVGQQRGRQVVKVRQLISRKTGNALDAFMRRGG
jgi:flagellar motor switch protein FliM